MISKKTVLVLGAGASLYYNYPLGDSLTYILGKEDNVYAEIEGRIAVNTAHIRTFKELIRFYDPISIDSFIAQLAKNHDQYIDTAKFLLCYYILHYENKGVQCLSQDVFKEAGEVFKGKIQHPKRLGANWYRFVWNALFNALDQGIIKEKNAISSEKPKGLSNKIITSIENLKIITFNYDVSLDHYLYSRAKSKEYSIFTPEEATQVTNLIKKNIIHVYGQVGKYQWQADEQDDPSYCRKDSEYGGDSDKANQIFRAYRYRNQLKLMSEERRSKDVISPHIKTCREWLENAERVFFLGYGFDDANNDLLALKESCLKTPQIHYTNYDDLALVKRKTENLFKFYFDLHGTGSYTRSGHHLYDCKPSIKGVYEALTEDFVLSE